LNIMFFVLSLLFDCSVILVSLVCRGQAFL
jgi:hypothetical protein